LVAVVKFADYRSIEAVNWSTLKHMDTSPLHYQQSLAGFDDKAEFALGRATHTMILEPDLFALEYAVYADGDRRGKKWETFKEANAGRTIIKVDEYEDACAMRDAILRHPVARRLIEGGASEKVIQWTDAATGIQCKARLDKITTAIVDVKSAASVDARAFGNAAGKYGYHTQGAFYHDGWKTVTGDDLPVKLIAVEKKKPFDVVVYALGEDDLEIGTDTYRKLLERVKECHGSGKWPGRAEEEQPLLLPSWIYGDGGMFDDDATSLDLEITG
jgi:hypothetical protein